MRAPRLLAAASLALLSVGLAASFVAPVAERFTTLGTLEAVFGHDGYTDNATCDLWLQNTTNPLVPVRRTFPCGFTWTWRDAPKGTRVHEALLDHTTGEVLNLAGLERGRLEEWVTIDGHLFTDDALAFVEVDGAGAMIPPPGSEGVVRQGWVSSGGDRSGTEVLVLPRTFEEVGSEKVRSREIVHWNATVREVPARWHGYDVVVFEGFDLWTERVSGWVVATERHLRMEMNTSEAARVFGIPAPEEPRAPGRVTAFALTYSTDEAARERHLATAERLGGPPAILGTAPRVAAASLLAGVVAGLARLGSWRG